jgi:hypothetical protein
MLESLGETAGSKIAYWRAAGLRLYGEMEEGDEPEEPFFRGAILVGSVAYFVNSNTAYELASDGTITPLSGTVPGTVPVFLARNNAATPDVVLVVPGDGAFILDTGGSIVDDYPDADVGQPNSVQFHKGFFIFTYGDGSTVASDVNSTNINTLNTATAESKPDTLWYSVPLGNGQLLLVGSGSMEAWGGVNDEGYPFSYVATVPRGTISPYAICGHQDGFGKGIFFAGDDNAVHQLDGYAPAKISPPDLDRLIAATADKNEIVVSCYGAGGHSFVVVQSNAWCWTYDCDLRCWVERESYTKSYWRARFPFKAFDKWLCGDTESVNILEITRDAQDEVGNPLVERIETGPFGAFPQTLRINGIEVYVTRGPGIAAGSDPEETDPEILVSISKNGGQDWTMPRRLKVGRQSVTAGRVRSSIWGQADNQGVRWRFDFSSAVDFGIMGADMQADALRA